MPTKLIQWMPRQAAESAEEYEQRKEQLYKEIDECGIKGYGRVSKLKKYLLEQGISHIVQMDYELREAYRYVLSTSVKQDKSYLKVFDEIKQYAIQKEKNTLSGRQNTRWKYKSEILYLPYHPDEKIVKKFAVTRQMDVLVWDFQKNCSEQLKRQIFDVLNNIIECNTKNAAMRIKLLALQKFYEFCVKSHLVDVEHMELEDIMAYTAYIKQQFGDVTIPGAYLSIVNNSRRILFLNAEQIHWDAGVWYLERLHLTAERFNQSSSLESISFLEIRSKENRRYVQEYMKYQLGITGQAISTIRGKFHFIQSFLKGIEEQNLIVSQCNASDVDMQIKGLQARGIQAKGFNEQISAIYHFFEFLEMKSYIRKVPFKPEYYYQKQIYVHHDRSVEDAVWKEVIQKLPAFPEHLRCMFLHLWCLGLRASEVCTLKGNAYYRQNGESWIQVYQVKMKNYKRIPIPEALYKVMQVYLERHQIQPEEYIFKNTKGGAMLYSTFRHQMLKHCEKNQIGNGNYLFQSHDYRHTVATLFYDSEVSLQGIRDYLGHSYEEMTRQYIDYMPKKIAKANDEYFSKPEHSLASCLKKGAKFGQ